jgi:hypothetical protein
MLEERQYLLRCYRAQIRKCDIKTLATLSQTRNRPADKRSGDRTHQSINHTNHNAFLQDASGQFVSDNTNRIISSETL